MKKAFKIVAYCLIISIVIALALCFIIIPERTKSAMDVVIGWLNTPLGIVGGTTITLGFVSYVIFKIIVLSRKTSVKEDIAIVERKINELKDKEELLKLRENEIKALLSNYSARIDNLSELLVKVCLTSPNAKIKALGNDILYSQKEIKEDLSNKQDLVEKYSDKELTEIFERIAELEKVVKSYGEREETSND